MANMTAGQTNTYEAIRALQAGQLDKANEFAQAALALEADEIDMRSRALAAAILMVETEADAETLKTMAVYNDMGALVSEVERLMKEIAHKEADGGCLVSLYTKRFGSDPVLLLLHTINKKVRNMKRVFFSRRMTTKHKAAIAEMGYQIIDQHDCRYTRLAVAGILYEINGTLDQRRSFDRGYNWIRSIEDDKETMKIINSIAESALVGDMEGARNIIKSARLGYPSESCSEIGYLAYNTLRWLRATTLGFLTAGNYREYGKQLIG